MTPLSVAARAAVVATLLAMLVPAAAARAASYTVRTCSNGSTSGWAGDPPARVSSTCRPGGGSLHAWVAGAPQEAAVWRFHAPPDTDVEAFSFARSYWRNAGVAFGTPLFQAQTFGTGRRYWRRDANYSMSPIGVPSSTERAAGLTGQTVLELAVVCGGGGSCRSPAATFDVTTAAIALHDASPPAIERVSGTLLSDGRISGTRTLRYTAADRGGGVARAELWIDGAELAAQVADINGGACRAVEGEFAKAVPCRPRATNTLTVDTRGIPDGAHELRLRVLDATASNHADWTARIEVDNVPPPANREPPVITGEARENERLLASPGSWTGTHPAFAYRWQRYESGWRDITAATSPSYVAGGDDVGHRLRVRVTATDREGTGVAYSESTDRVLPDESDDGGGTAPPPGPGGSPGGGSPGGDGGGGGGDGGPSGGSSGGGPSGPGGPSGAGGPGSPSTAAPLAIEAGLGAGSRRSLTVPYGRAVAVRGMVRDSAGVPAHGVALTLLAAVDGRWRQVGATLTRDDGHFTVLAGPGPSRRLVIAAGAVRSRSLRLAVRAPVRLWTVRPGGRTAAGAPTLVRGDLRGGHIPPGGVFVTIQARRSRRWVGLTTLVTDRRGRFHGRVAGARRLRAAVARQPGYPFAAGVSRPRGVR